jgi:tetratricopeptide (TPR) repeat protein
MVSGMGATVSLAQLNSMRRLAEAGRHATLVQELDQRPPEAIEHSATLALLYGTAQARLGNHTQGERWVGTALERARIRGDRAIEARALNVLGGIALEGGRIEDAAEYFMRALDLAERDGNHATVGRCSNNLGIIAHLQGDYDRAIGRYTLAVAACQRAGLDRGLAETQHNLAITYRDRGEFLHAFKAADLAVQRAQSVGDAGLRAATLAGRAEIRLASGDVAMALWEIERALELHRNVGDVVGETEDLRVLAACHAAVGRLEAEQEFRQVIDRSEEHGTPARAAAAERDLARLLERVGRLTEAVDVARRARARYQQLGAVAEIERLDDFLRSLAARQRVRS